MSEDLKESETITIGGTPFEMDLTYREKKGKSYVDKRLFKNTKQAYTNFGKSKPLSIKMIRRKFFTDDDTKYPTDEEKEIATLKAIEEWRTGKKYQGIGIDEMVKEIKEKDGNNATYLNVSKEALRGMLTQARGISSIVIPEITGEEKKAGVVSKKTGSTKKIKDKKSFKEDPDVQRWLEDKTKGIGSKTRKSKTGFENSLFKVFQLLNIDAGWQFKEAKGEANTPEEKMDWLTEKFEKIVKPYETEPYAINPETKKLQKKPATWDGGAGAYYKDVMAARSFANYYGFNIPKLKDTSHPLAASVVGHGLHSKIEIKIEQIKELREYLHQICVNEGNMDPYVYFMVAMATGMRKTEGLTIPLKSTYIKPAGYYSKGKSKGKPFYEINLFNRKILHTVTDKKLAYTMSIVYDEKTNELITERLEKHKDKGLLIGSLTAGAPDNYIKVPKEFTGIEAQKKNQEIALSELPESEQTPDDTPALKENLYKPIREAYKKAGLIKKLSKEENEVVAKKIIIFYKDEKLDLDEVENMRDKETKQEIFKDGEYSTENIKVDGEDKMIPRFSSGYDESSYFWKRPLHSIRHAFAQYWLRNSEWNFGWVAEHGHWKTIEELKTSYGGIPKDQFIKDSLIFVTNAAKEEGNKEINIDKEEFDKVTAKQKEADEIQDENVLLGEQSEGEEDENE